jgi:hypothetical protein
VLDDATVDRIETRFTPSSWSSWTSTRSRSAAGEPKATRKLIAPETKGAQPSASSAPSSPSEKVNRDSSFAARGMRTVGDPADGQRGGISSTVRANAMKTHGETYADGEDGNFPPQSAPKSAGWSARVIR